MATAEIAGIATYYEVTGSGPPILMFAPGGFDATAAKWTTQGVYARIRLLDHLAKAHTCIIFDRREAGRSGSEFIQPEHLLQGLLAEDQRDWVRAMGLIDETAAMQNVAAPSRPFFSAEQAGTLRQLMAKSESAAAPTPPCCRFATRPAPNAHSKSQ